jgi:hypothetical protein
MAARGLALDPLATSLFAGAVLFVFHRFMAFTGGDAAGE